MESWNVDALSLREVRVEGTWAGSGVAVTWAGTVRESEVALNSLEGGLAWAGRLDADGVELQTGDDVWVDGRVLRSELEGRLEGDRVTVVLGDSRYGSASSPVPLTGVMESESGDFRMALSSPSCPCPQWRRFASNVREVLAPAMEGVTGSAEELSGKHHGRGRKGLRASWDGGWAVRLTEWPGRIVGGRVAQACGHRVRCGDERCIRMEGCGAIDRCGRGRGRVQGSAGPREQDEREGGRPRVFRPAGVWPWLGLRRTQAVLPWWCLTAGDGCAGQCGAGQTGGQWADWTGAEGTKVTASDVAWEQGGAAMGVKDVQVDVSMGTNGI